jgi:hypothetical protein
MANTNENDTAPEPTSRDAVAAAFDAYEQAGPDSGLITLEEKDVPAGAAEEKEPGEADRAALGGESDRATEVPEGEEARARDEKTGRYTKTEKGVAAKPPILHAKGGQAAEPQATPQAQPDAVPPPGPGAPAPRTLRAPQSWRPVAREGFEKLPAATREEIWRLEGERERVVRETAPLRRFSEAWQQTIAPYEQAIRASGVEPLQAVSNVMRTVHALGTQPAPSRARIIHALMQMYGVSTDALADVIDSAGGVPAASAAPQQPQATYDPRFDAYLAQQQQREYAHEVQANAAADAELEEFANDHEFIDDVLSEMADFMNVAAARGVDMDYDMAYTRAITLRPDLLEILQQREAAAASPAGPTQRALQASSSVRGSPSRRPAPGKKFEDSREAAAAAYDAHAGEGGRV